MAGTARGDLDELVRIERRVGDDSFRGAGRGEWQTVEEDVWASIVDVLPSRAEKMAEGLNIATRPARVRMDFRTDVDASMRLIETTEGVDGRVMQIIAGPATIGNRDAVEFMVEEYSTAGGGA